MYRFDKGGMYREQVYPLREDSLGSQMSKSQLLKRDWSEDMARNVRTHGCESLQKPWRKRAKAHGKRIGLKLRKLRKWPPFGRPKAAKVTDSPSKATLKLDGLTPCLALTLFRGD